MSAGERRLAAIMFTDIVGYSLISARNERKALEQVTELRSLLQGVFPRFDGRVVKTMGDGFLVEFASVVKAVDCAVEAQNEISHSNVGRKEEDRVMIRIGIHVGDLVHTEGDVLGDAVNVASRVQSLAEPGGICVTRQVFDQVKGKVDWRMISAGLTGLKNIPGSVEIYRVLPQRGSQEVEEEQELDPRRVAILPFANLSPDPNDRYFADGVTEELISTVSKIRELSVISRTSAMRYRGTTLPMRQVGRELRVGSILEGSIRKSGNKVRIAAQLLNVEDDRYIWSQDYDRDLTDIFGVQGDIAERVAGGLKVELLQNDRWSLQKKQTSSPEAYTLYLKGRYYWNERSRAGANKAISYFDAAARLDPLFAEAYCGLADVYAMLSDYRWMPHEHAAALAKMNVVKALEIDDSLAEAHASLGLISVNHSWDFATGEREFKRAIELKPNYASSYQWYGVTLLYLRRYEDSFRMMEKAIELDPSSYVLRQGLAVALLGLGRTKKAMDQFNRLATENPDSVAVHYWLSLTHLAQGNFAEAIRESEKEVDLDKESSDAMLDLAWILAVAGDKERARKILGEVESEMESPVGTGMVELGLGESQKGYDLLETARAGRDPSLLYFRSIPVFARYWSDPRWAEIERRAGFPT
ncbi:MAG TPA: tetratricopeptide repeat protein [Nitrososphaerales archaeon]|nr:tetratricopeptide repeat protein [Nitrososphaerales archaeon]